MTQIDNSLKKELRQMYNSCSESFTTIVRGLKDLTPWIPPLNMAYVVVHELAGRSICPPRYEVQGYDTD